MTVAESLRPCKADTPRYLPIAEHGLIGDLRTAALVGTNGTIDWYCCPRFDAPSVFALDPGRRPGRVRSSWPRTCRRGRSSSTSPTPTC